MVTEETTTTEYETQIVRRQDWQPIGVTVGVNYDTFTAAFDNYVLGAGFEFAYYGVWRTDKHLINLPEGVVLAARLGGHLERGVVRVRGHIAFVAIDSDGWARANVYGHVLSLGDLEAAMDQLRAWLPRRPQPEEVYVDMTFTNWQGNQPVSRVRRIDAPSWNDIRANYPDAVTQTVDRLMTAFEPGVAGRLVLLHGPPGTGKTYVIRALAREWRKWCQFEYITDPEVLFGDAQYMMATLLADADDDDKWRLLIVEDAGELLGRDAKRQTGQGLSRLLNFTEGLIGQGLRVMILITTNDKLASLNEAVARPGRTAAEIEFIPFSVEEANAWLAARDRLDLAVSEPATLAELYAALSGERITTHHKRERIGFLKG